MCIASANASLAGSFASVDNLKGMLSAKICSAAEQITKEIRSVVSGPHEAGKHKSTISSRSEAYD